MSALNPVGVNTILNGPGVGRTSSPIPHQSDTIRVVAEIDGVHIAFGANPAATDQNFYIGIRDTEEISIGRPCSQRVVGVTTGTATIIDFPEGTGSPFGVGDAVTLTAPGQTNFNFTHKLVTAIDSSSGPSGYFSERITIDHDSASVTDTFDSSLHAELRGSLKFHVSGFGTAYVQQVQVS